MTLPEKFSALATGVDLPRRPNLVTPDTSFEQVLIESVDVRISCWKLPSPAKLGTVAIFHGYAGNKSSMLDKAYEFLRMGYDVLLVDFRGAGDSNVNYTTIGYFEAEEVAAVYKHLKDEGEDSLILFGTSMGAVAIMKAIHDHQLDPSAVILECPFGNMYTTVKARFKIMGVPAFPIAGLLTFWGGMQHGFWAYSHNPEEYAKNIKVPVLLLYGEKDDRVSREETETIFDNLKGIKTLRTYPMAGHENYLLKYRKKWKADVVQFLKSQSIDHHAAEN